MEIPTFMTTYESKSHRYRIKERTYSDNTIVYIVERQPLDRYDNFWNEMITKKTVGEAYITIQCWIIDDNATIAQSIYTDKILETF